MRLLLASFALAAIVFTGFACGGDDDDAAPGDDDSAVEESASPENTPGPTSTPNEDERATARSATSTPIPPLPTATPVPDDAPSIEVRFGETVYAPTASQFAALEQATVDGLDGEGVLLATLAAQVGAPEGALVTIQGFREGEGTASFLREGLPAIGGVVLFTVSDEGHISLASTYWDEAEWLPVVASITFE